MSSSNFPRYDVNPNTGEPLCEHLRTLVAEQTLYHDAGRPSHVVLPIVGLDYRSGPTAFSSSVQTSGP